MCESECSGRSSTPVRRSLPAMASCLQWVSSTDKAAQVPPSRPEPTPFLPSWPGTSPHPPSPAAPEGLPLPRSGVPPRSCSAPAPLPGQASLREALVLLIFFRTYQQTPVLGLCPSTMVGRSPNLTAATIASSGLVATSKDFGELRHDEVRRIHLPRTSVNKAALLSALNGGCQNSPLEECPRI